jgi:hypothetical protein
MRDCNSSNEGLQAADEELETSREELRCLKWRVRLFIFSNGIISKKNIPKDGSPFEVKHPESA